MGNMCNSSKATEVQAAKAGTSNKPTMVSDTQPGADAETKPATQQKTEVEAKATDDKAEVTATAAEEQKAPDANAEEKSKSEATDDKAEVTATATEEQKAPGANAEEKAKSEESPKEDVPKEEVKVGDKTGTQEAKGEPDVKESEEGATKDVCCCGF